MASQPNLLDIVVPKQEKKNYINKAEGHKNFNFAIIISYIVMNSNLVQEFCLQRKPLVAIALVPTRDVSAWIGT